MGLFDSVVGNCPKCHNDMYEQTKAGDCNMSTFEVGSQMNIYSAAVVEGVILSCDTCKRSYEVHTSAPKLVETYLVPLQDYDELDD